MLWTRRPSPGEKARHLEPYIQPTLIPLKERVFAWMLRGCPLWRPGFVMERLGPAEGAVIGRISLLNPHLAAIRTIENQHPVDGAAVVTDCENAVFLRNRL